MANSIFKSLTCQDQYIKVKKKMKKNLHHLKIINKILCSPLNVIIIRAKPGIDL